MTIKTTKWRPDTCGCELEYTWDDSVSADQRTHTLLNVLNKCPDHSTLTNSDVYSAIIDENPRKNIALTTALDNGPTSLYDVVNGARQLKPTITYTYSWTGTAPNRVLRISFTGVSLTTTQKNTIQTAENTRLGNGKVAVV